MRTSFKGGTAGAEFELPDGRGGLPETQTRHRGLAAWGLLRTLESQLCVDPSLRRAAGEEVGRVRWSWDMPSPKDTETALRIVKLGS